MKREASPAEIPAKKPKYTLEDDVIPKSQWPDSFKELELIFFRLNTYFSFICTRNHIVPSFELIKPNIEKALKRPVTHEDIAKLVALLPRDILFKYVEEDQIHHTQEKMVKLKPNGEFVRKDVDMFKLKDMESENHQVLLLELIDGNPMKSKSNENYRTHNNGHPYDAKTLKKVITRRNEKFVKAVSKFLALCTEDQNPTELLTERAQPHLPHEIVHIDPIEAMKQNKMINRLSERPKISLLIEEIKKDPSYRDQIVENGLFELPPREPKFGDLNFEFPEPVSAALLTNKKVERFYSHQASALNAINDGNHVVVTTSTSSGKSLIYQVPAMKVLYEYIESQEDQSGPRFFENMPTAMYIFPTKALAQDQKRSLRELFDDVPLLKPLMVETFDGDTEPEKRRQIRENAKVVFTNPDMLHANVLPNYLQWSSFLRNLKVIVIDELHTYKGLFGSHVALVIRRLRRVCHYLGNDSVQFISCSATLKDPVEHMELIFGIQGAPIVHVSEDGSPSGEKYVVVWNPPLLDLKTHERESFITETAKLLIKLVLQNIKTICFCVVRRTVELVMKEVRHILKEMNRLDLENQIMSYRGGYSISDRRDIEREMFTGSLKAIIATNALELGIDIGVLDAVLICGFPISVSNFHQQSGRAGRRNKDSLTLYVGLGDPVNQYYVTHPELLVSQNFQDIILDFTNVMIMENHVQCAAFELPIHLEKGNDAYFFSHDSKSKELFEGIVTTKLVKDQYGYHCHPRYLPWPSKHVSLRGLEEDMFAVVDITNGRNVVIEEIEASRTSFTLYEEGIMIHQGLPYIVREFNADECFAKVERVSVDWVTKQRDYTDVDPLEIEKIRSQKADSDVPIYFGSIRTTIKVFGFFKVDKRGKILDSVDVKNPPVIIDSKGFWIDIPMEALNIINSRGLNVAAGIHAAEHALMNVMPLVIVSGIDEMQTECKAPEKEFAKRQTVRVRPARLIFSDTKGGKFGSGLSIKAFENIDDILAKAYERVYSCDCEIGCPECVAGAYCKENSLVISKGGALVILSVILGKKVDMNKVPPGPEKNLPDIETETTEPVSSQVKFSDDLEIVDVKNIQGEEYSIKTEDE